jgi:hypothetical protein
MANSEKIEKAPQVAKTALTDEINNDLWLVDQSLKGKDGAGMPLGDFRKEQWLDYGVTGIGKTISAAKEHGIELGRD